MQNTRLVENVTQKFLTVDTGGSIKKEEEDAVPCRAGLGVKSILFNVVLRPQRPYGQLMRDEEPRTATSTFTQLLTSVKSLA